MRQYLPLLIIGVVIFALFAGLSLRKNNEQREISLRTAVEEPEIIREEVPEDLARATFATGCFWCMEAIFQETPGVTNAIAGYAGGEEHNPTYEDTYLNKTTHKEAVMVYYDPAQVSYADLLELFWQNIDPTDPSGQFVDQGPSYVAAVFYEDDEQQALAEKTKQELADSGRFDKPVVTEILPYTTFYQAEDYHQDFYLKSPGRYESYSGASGRKQFKELIWEQIQKEEA